MVGCNNAPIKIEVIFVNAMVVPTTTRCCNSVETAYAIATPTFVNPNKKNKTEKIRESAEYVVW